MDDIDSDDIPSSTLGATPSELGDYEPADLPDDLKRGTETPTGTPSATPTGTPAPGASKKGSSKSAVNSLTKSGALKQKPGPKPGGGKVKSSSGGATKNAVNPGLKQTTFSMVTPINQKNYYTEYLKRDDQIYVYRQVQEETKKAKAGSVAVSNNIKGTPSAAATPDPDGTEGKEENQTIVIHPGSRNLRVGFGVDPYPKTVKMAIARRQQGGVKKEVAEVDQEDVEMTDDAENDPVAAAIKTVKKDLKERMKFYKCRIQPGSTDLTTNYNTKNTQPEEIPEHNDPSKVDWTDTTDKKEYYVGESALRIKDPNYTLRWPIIHGCFNETAMYSSPQEVLGDLAIILVEALEAELGVKFSDYKNYNVILLIPDLYDKTYVSALVDLLLHKMDFPRVALLQEGMGATFGAGISTSCVIDVGAQKTSICCVEDGMVVPDSRVNLKYGGDDVTNAFLKLLQNIAFPYNVDPKDTNDMLLIEELKTQYATTDEASIGVSTGQLIHPRQNKLTQKYTFKFYDEGMLAPLGLFYPELFEPLNTSYKEFLRDRHRLFPRNMDVYESNKEDNPTSGAQTALLIKQGLIEPPEEPVEGAEAVEKEIVDDVEQPYLFLTGLDHAVIQSIKSAAVSDPSRPGKMYENIIIIGGGAQLAGFETLLVDRLGIWRSMARNDGEDDGVSDEAIAVMPPPRDMDPQILTWKGGAVFSRLKVVEEMYITQKEWDLLGPRSIHYRTMFAY